MTHAFLQTSEVMVGSIPTATMTLAMPTGFPVRAPIVRTRRRPGYLAGMTMTGDRWEYTNRYAREVFGSEDEVLTGLLDAARSEQLPDWAVSADIGRLLQILTTMTQGRLALEIGTLGGYSAIWIARGLAPHGRLITIERDARHASFAEGQFVAAGLQDRITVRRGDALDVLPVIAEEVGLESLDLVFVDADKTEYPDYFEAVRPLIAPGGVLVVDNVFGTGSTWIDDLSDAGTRATDRMNRTIAADPWYVSTALAARQGLLVARRVGTTPGRA